jgi:D-alanyl-D-alanine carboxypeptidase
MVPVPAVSPVVAAVHRHTYARRPMEALVRHRRLHREGRRGASAPRRRAAHRRDHRALARVAVLAAALGLLASLGVRPLVEPSLVQAMGPLPACRYDDLLTTPRLYTDWPVTLVDTILRVTRSYVPPDLVSVSQAGIAGNGKVRALVIEDLKAMAEAAAAAGAAIGVQSAYRSYEKQQQVFDDWVAIFGYRRALEVSARPGHSEHQLGLAIDFRSDPGGSPFDGDWGTTAAGKWMKAHAWEYGFVLSYPKGKMGVTCYDYEPWHYRFVGREMAGMIHASGQTPRQYLWANFTTTVVPAPTPRPGRTAAPPTLPIPTPTSAPTSSSAPFPPATAPATTAPSASPTPSAPATPGPTPAASGRPGDGGPIASLEPAVVAGLAVGVGGLLVLGWMVLRRGRSGVGL